MRNAAHAICGKGDKIRLVYMHLILVSDAQWNIEELCVYECVSFHGDYGRDDIRCN